MRRAWLALALAAGAPGAALAGRAAYLEAKAGLASVLIARAFDAHVADGKAHRPWSWSDATPVARLEVPRLGVTRYVLSDASGRALAFGLGRIGGSSTYAGHRDSWAKFLGDVRVGDGIRVTRYAESAVFRVKRVRVVRDDDATAVVSGDDRLSLVTCWPLDDDGSTSWRYVVEAERCDGAWSSSSGS